MTDDDFNPVVIGRLGAAYGVKGWLHLQSFTDPQDNILEYPSWRIEHQGHWQSVVVEHGKPHANGLVVKLSECNDRDQAKLLTNCLIAIDNAELPELAPGEYYWRELEDMQVINRDNVELGKVDHVFATGANDVLVVIGDKERLIPFVKEQYIDSVDLANRIIRVDWDSDF